ncbi:F-box/kelch-repeat protein KIB1-like [Elaeis guineensis]|uniref:F-box protein At2g17036-like n=1 Tax=Elaeis guineensis var. tenera TaxID=51953 RepID=A0A6I9QA51_ELAGV|nr:F-box protein At2g17036-like [Elaeis guineensis]
MSWAGLLPELQTLILGRLEVADYLRFAAVCRSWCSTVAERPCLPKPQIPWLMLSDSTRDPDTRRFFSRPDQKMYKIHLPEIHGRGCIGSSEGWLFTTDEVSELHALNPLTGASLAFPSVTTFSDVAGAIRDSDGRITDYILLVDELGEVPYELEHMRWCYYFRAILHPSSAVVAVIHGGFNDLAFARAGDESWTELQPPQPLTFMDIIFRKGLLHALSTSGALMVFDLDAPGSPMVTCVAGPDSEMSKRGRYKQRYLVESPDGEDVFQVWKDTHWFLMDGNRRQRGYAMFPDDARMAVDFAIFKLDERRKDWSEVEDLGDVALFLGRSRSMALSTREFPELTSSCIYFTNDYTDGDIMGPGGKRDVAAFNLKDASCQRYDSRLTDSEWNWPPQIWIEPSLLLPQICSLQVSSHDEASAG